PSFPPILSVYTGGRGDLHSFPTRRSSDLAGRPRRCSTPSSYSRCSASAATSSTTRCREVPSSSRSEGIMSPESPTTAVLSGPVVDRKSTRLNSSHVKISYAVFCLKKKRQH